MSVLYGQGSRVRADHGCLQFSRTISLPPEIACMLACIYPSTKAVKTCYKRGAVIPLVSTFQSPLQIILTLSSLDWFLNANSDIKMSRFRIPTGFVVAHLLARALDWLTSLGALIALIYLSIKWGKDSKTFGVGFALVRFPKLRWIYRSLNASRLASHYWSTPSKS